MALPPIVGQGDAWPPVVATFACDGCGGLASTLTLVPPFGSDPQAPPDDPLGRGTMFREDVRLSIDGPIHATHHLLTDEAIGAIGRLEAAMRAGNAAAICDLDREWAPFLCRECAKSYCKNCWMIWIEDDEGFYDCTRGRCPSGHVRTMDD